MYHEDTQVSVFVAACHRIDYNSLTAPGVPQGHCEMRPVGIVRALRAGEAFGRAVLTGAEAVSSLTGASRGTSIGKRLGEECWG